MRKIKEYRDWEGTKREMREIVSEIERGERIGRGEIERSKGDKGAADK